ncbi:MAG: tetraacyldisaccharide 4'-kinase [Flavobacterium sp.]|nr:tetraacyldisaccharide 4'-kinase [Pedobacter sp.]
MRFLRLLLFPLSFAYALGVFLRNRAYDLQILKSRRFKIPVISVGNLAAGGSGKSPMTEYLVSLLKEEYKIAILSRGYGRRSKGYFTVKTISQIEDVGDEPLQFKRKFPDVTVAVCEDRVEGIKQLKQHHQVIVLDDAFQHRGVKPGLSLLLFDYYKLFKPQWFLPSGDLREPLSSRKRAEIIVVTKTPFNLIDSERQRIKDRVNPLSQQQLFFSYLKYHDLISLYLTGSRLPLETINPETHLFLLTGIASTEPFVDHLRRYTQRITHHTYPDHHQFSKKNIIKLASEFKNETAVNKLIITTEKDAQRLKSSAFKELLKLLPVYYLPVKACFHQEDEKRFNDLIKKYVREHSINNRIHKA